MSLQVLAVVGGHLNTVGAGPVCPIKVSRLNVYLAPVEARLVQVAADISCPLLLGLNLAFREFKAILWLCSGELTPANVLLW